MKDLAGFRRQILLHCLALAGISEIVSLWVIGPEPRFLFGMILGTAATMINFSFLVFSGQILAATKSSGAMVGGYFLRICIYGIVFYLCLRIGGLLGALACGIGFLTLAASILIIYGIESHLPGAKKNPLGDWTEPKKWRDPSEWEEEDEYEDG